MSLSENIKSAAEFADCTSEIKKLDEIIQYLDYNKMKNIVVLGETNCGKTTLMNLLAGVEVRKPTRLSLGEEPLKVVFDSDEKDADFETVNAENAMLSDKGIAIHEIPMNLAVDYETKLANPILEKMDAVIYVISAIAPFTASDVANIGALVNKYPLVIYVSKSDLLETEEEYKEILEYIKEQFAFRFEGCFCEFYDSKDSAAEKKILSLISEMEIDEIRKNHIAQIEQRAKNCVSKVLNQKLHALELERKAKEKEADAAEGAFREEQLRWNQIRLCMMEKEQEAVDYVDKKVIKSKIAVKQDLMEKIDKSSSVKSWVKAEFKPLLQEKLTAASETIRNDVADIVNMHVAWLVAEVNKEFDRQLVIEDMKISNTKMVSRCDECTERPTYRNMILAAGSGIVAGSAIVSSIPLTPTCIVAIPASLLTVVFIKGSIEEQKKYIKAVKKFVDNSCERNYTTLVKQIHKALHKFYEDMIDQIRKLSDMPGIHVEYDDMKEQEAQIKDMLYKLN